MCGRGATRALCGSGPNGRAGAEGRTTRLTSAAARGGGGTDVLRVGLHPEEVEGSIVSSTTTALALALLRPLRQGAGGAPLPPAAPPMNTVTGSLTGGVAGCLRFPLNALPKVPVELAAAAVKGTGLATEEGAAARGPDPRIPLAAI